MKKTSLSAALLMCNATLLSGCVIHIDGDHEFDGGGVSSILGNIDVSEHDHAGDVSSVNGNVDLDSHSSADDISIVNGNLGIDDHVHVNGIDIVNGDIHAGPYLKVAQSIETVNGNITIGEESHIAKSIKTVNGDISLTHAQVGRDIETLNGDISIDGESVIMGDIIYRKPDSRWFDNDDKPTLSLGASVRIEGRIILERPVELTLNNPIQQEKVIVSYSANQ